MKDIDTGILEEPDFAVYIRDYHPPDDSLERIQGFWRWEDGCPIKRIETQTWYAQTNHK